MIQVWWWWWILQKNYEPTLIQSQVTDEDQF